MYCMKCGKEIPANAPNKYYYSKLCANCYEERQTEVRQQTTRVGRKRTNGVAITLMILAILTWVFCGLAGIGYCFGSYLEIGIPILIAGFIGGTFVYAFGEIIQLLEDIKNKDIPAPTEEEVKEKEKTAKELAQFLQDTF